MGRRVAGWRGKEASFKCFGYVATLQNLAPESLLYLLALFNSILSSGTYPLYWKTVIIFPELKPESDLSHPISHRPKALSCVLGKLFQKILNKRLHWFLESNNLLSSFQYGFGEGRNTTQALVDLQSEINGSVSTKTCLY